MWFSVILSIFSTFWRVSLDFYCRQLLWNYLFSVTFHQFGLFSLENMGFWIVFYVNQWLTESSLHQPKEKKKQGKEQMKKQRKSKGNSKWRSKEKARKKASENSREKENWTKKNQANSLSNFDMKCFPWKFHFSVQLWWTFAFEHKKTLKYILISACRQLSTPTSFVFLRKTSEGLQCNLHTQIGRSWCNFSMDGSRCLDSL